MQIRQNAELEEEYRHIKPPKILFWPIPKLLIYGKKLIGGRYMMFVKIQSSTVYVHLDGACIEQSHGWCSHDGIHWIYLGDKGEEFQEFLHSLNRHKKFVIQKSGVEKRSFKRRSSPISNRERAKILFKMKDGSLLISFVGSPKKTTDFRVSMPSYRDTTCT